MSQRTIYTLVLLFYTLSTLGTAEYCHFPLSNYVLGQQAGSTSVTLLWTQMPAHSHTVAASSNGPSQGSPAAAAWATAGNIPYASTANATMSPGALASSGGSQPHDKMAPVAGTQLQHRTGRDLPVAQLA